MPAHVAHMQVQMTKPGRILIQRSHNGPLELLAVEVHAIVQYIR